MCPLGWSHSYRTWTKEAGTRFGTRTSQLLEASESKSRLCYGSSRHDLALSKTGGDLSNGWNIDTQEILYGCVDTWLLYRNKFIRKTSFYFERICYTLLTPMLIFDYLSKVCILHKGWNWIFNDSILKICTRLHCQKICITLVVRCCQWAISSDVISLIINDFLEISPCINV